MAYQSSDIRNIALVGHGSCGKTSLGEAMLFNTGASSRLGVTREGTSVLDFEPEERKREGSIGSSFAWVEHDGKKINIVDTPGDGNFIYDAFTAMMGADAAVVVVSCPDGLEVQTERVFHRAVELGLPRLLVINKMDRDRANPQRVLGEVQENLRVKAVPLQVPIGAEGNFRGVVSLLDRKAYTWNQDGSGTMSVEDIPGDMEEEVEEAWVALMESVAEADEDLLEMYLETFELTRDQVLTGLKTGLASGDLVPVIYTSASMNMGVQPLLNFVAAIAPNPLERGDLPVEGEGDMVTSGSGGAFVAQVIRTFMDEHSGKVTIFRVFAGSAPGDGSVRNNHTEESERLGTTYALRGTEREACPAVAGDIVAAAKLKNTRTNDTLAAGTQVELQRTQYPFPMMSYTIHPIGKAGEDKLKTAVQRLMEEDPTLTRSYDTLSHLMVLQGMGQAHLDMAAEKLRRKFKVEVETALPAVPYRETIKKRVDGIEGKHKKQTGGAGQFGVCYLSVEPLGQGEGFQFEDKIHGGAIPKQLIPSVEKGVRIRLEKGFLAGYPAVDLRVSLTDGKYHPVDSKDVAFQMAGSKGIRAAMAQGGVQIMEPIYRMKIIVPTDVMGDILGDMTSRRGRVLGMDQKGTRTVITAVVPLAEIQRYSPDLNAMSSGQGSFTMAFESYECLPSNLVEKVVKNSPFRDLSTEED